MGDSDGSLEISSSSISSSTSTATALDGNTHHEQFQGDNRPYSEPERQGAVPPLVIPAMPARFTSDTDVFEDSDDDVGRTNTEMTMIMSTLAQSAQQHGYGHGQVQAATQTGPPNEPPPSSAPLFAPSHYRSVSLDSFIHLTHLPSLPSPTSYTSEYNLSLNNPPAPFPLASTDTFPLNPTSAIYTPQPTSSRPILHLNLEIDPSTNSPGVFASSPMSSPRTTGDPSHRAAHGAGGKTPSPLASGGGAATDNHDTFTSAMQDGVSSVSAFHRRRMSNPTRRRASIAQPQPPLVAHGHGHGHGHAHTNAHAHDSSLVYGQGITVPNHPPLTPSSAGPSSARGWFGNRLAPPTEHKRSKSDDERESDNVDLSLSTRLHNHPKETLTHAYESTPSGPSSSPSLVAKNRRQKTHTMRPSGDAYSTPSDYPTSPIGYPTLLQYSHPQGVSVAPVLSPLPVVASLPSSSERLALPQDPDHILPLSTPPPNLRESLDYVDPRNTATSSGHSTTPRTSMSLSEGTSWGMGRSYSDSSAGDDEDSPIITSGWWWRAHPRPPRPSPVRLPSRSTPPRLLPIGPRRWGWLLAPMRHWSGMASYEYQLLAKNSKKHYDREKTCSTTTRRKRRTVWGSKYLAQALDFVDSEPWLVTLGLVLFAIFALCLGLSIKYILDPDKAALPWREYASQDYPTVFSIQHAEWDNLALGGSLPPLSVLKPVSNDDALWPYPGHELAPHKEHLHGGPRVDNIEPTTVYVAVFTYDVGIVRRNLIRNSYATHPRSRTPGSEGVRLRFVMGRPRPAYRAAVEAEMEKHGDIVVLDIDENMNEGKTHAFFSWAADNATVPDWEYPSHPRSAKSEAEFAAIFEQGVKPTPIYRGEKRPDYIVKADDDAFIMLGELERHLRVTPRTKTFWGYLVRERFMAGECYAMSLDLAEYIRDTASLREHVRGKEDKLVSRWLRTHPAKEEILWFSERTWIYDHPAAGTVYSHGYLFPNEVLRVRSERQHGLSEDEEVRRHAYLANVDAFSTVSQFGTRYRPPLRGLTPKEKAEALVEGSPMSLLRFEARAAHAHTREDMMGRVDEIMKAKPSFKDRFLGQHHGGTVVVHYIKRANWFQETIDALLGDEEVED